MFRYYTLANGVRSGLLRVDEDGEIESVQNGEWVEDTDAIRYFVGIGGDAREPILLSDSEALVLANAYGVTL